MNKVPSVSDDDIQDYIDRRLDTAQSAQMEAAIADDPVLAAKVLAYTTQDAALREAGEQLLHDPVPAYLRDTVRNAPRRRFPRYAMQIAASIAFLAIGAAGGWYGSNYFDDESLLQPFIEQATLAHKLAVIEQPEGLELDSLDQTRISPRYVPAEFGNVSVRMPTLKRSNLTPVSLVSAVDPSGARMTVTYTDRQNRPRTLLIRKLSTGDDLPVKYNDDGEIPALHWIDGSLIYILVGEGTKDELVSIAEEIYRSSATAVKPSAIAPRR